MIALVVSGVSHNEIMAGCSYDMITASLLSVNGNDFLMEGNGKKQMV